MVTEFINQQACRLTVVIKGLVAENQKMELDMKLAIPNKLACTMNAHLLKRKWETSLIVRYIFVGAWNTIFSIILLYALFFLFTSKHYELELAITFIVSTGQSFATQRKFVWKSSGVVKAELMRFFVGTGSQYLLNSLSLYLLNREFHITPSHAALPLLLFITCCFYFVNKKIVFK